MKIIVTSVGTRGDMEPLLAVGEILREKGHQVFCLFPEQFRELAEDSGFEFGSLGSRFIEMLESEVGQIAMGSGGSIFKKLVAFVKLALQQKDINREMVRKQYEFVEQVAPDYIVHNGKVMYPVIWSLKHPGKTTLISPVPYLHYVKNHAHVSFNKDFGPFFNKLTYRLANYGLVKTIMNSLQWLDSTKGISQKQIQHSLFTNNAIYTISPTLFERPDYWPSNIKVLGYHERDKTVNWQPDEALNGFLARYPKILLVTFGSMLNPAPAEKTQLILEILERNGIPAIINTAAGGLVKPDNYSSELIHFVSRIPYDWVLPQIYGVVHHGGSGTTHMALKYGCASLIIPHIIDQFVWNKIIAQKGAGPEGIAIGKIRTKNLAPKILELVNNPDFKKKAEEIGAQMNQEDFREEVCQAIVS